MERTGSKHIDIKDRTDKEVIQAALGGDAQSQQAFDVLYNRYSLSVMSQIRKMISIPDEAEDILQETFSKAFQQLHTFDTDRPFATWVFTIARNTTYDHISSQKARGSGMKVDMAEEDKVNIDLPDSGPTPEEAVIRDQSQALVDDIIEGLPDLYREIMKLLHVEHLGYKEIAQRTGLPLNTVKTRISRARKMITESVRKAEEESDL